jgi:hypothetical protein
MPDANIVTDAVDKFEKLPTGGKVAVVGITVGVAVLGIYIANKRAATATGTTTTTPTGTTVNGGTPLDPTQFFSGTGLLGTPGTTDTVTANGPVMAPTQPGTTTAPTAGPVPPANPPTRTGNPPVSGEAKTRVVTTSSQMHTFGELLNYLRVRNIRGYTEQDIYNMNAANFRSAGINGPALNRGIPLGMQVTLPNESKGR